MKASLFYTGLVAEMYDALVSYRAPVAFYADLIRTGGEPALEIGCGTGHPLLDLVEQGLDVHGLDSSRDMLVRCEAKAEARGLRVRLHQQEMQSFALPIRYRTIFFAGAQTVERPWLLRWYSQDEFRRLLRSAGYDTEAVLGEDGKPVADDAPAFTFIARRAPGSAGWPTP